MMSSENKLLVRRLYEEVIGRGNFAVADELVATDYLGHSTEPEMETHGVEGYKRFFAMMRAAFPNLQITVEDQLAEGDKVVSRWTAQGTHEGEYFGIPSTGKAGAMTGITIDRIADGKVVECWTNSDDLGLLRQLGVFGEPATAPPGN